jgi:hypothetical protein
MSKPTIRIHNAETNEIIDREMTDAEFAIYQAKQATLTARAEEEATKATEKAEVLAQLGITEEQAKLLLG